MRQRRRNPGGIALTAAGLLALGGFLAAAEGAPSPYSAEPAENLLKLRPADPAPRPVGSALPRPQAAPAGNPLWGVPLRALSGTRERPLFSPSRRPPPAVVAAPAVPPPAPPAKPAEPDHPPLTLIGTIVGSTANGFGIFLDPATRTVVRLKTGEDHGGWVLREVRARDAVFRKDKRSATLSLPAPGQQAAQLSTAAIPTSGTWLDGDGQLIAPPPTKPGPPPLSAARDNL